MRKISIFGQDVFLKSQDCSCNGAIGQSLEPGVNIYVRLTDICPARCPFCAFYKPETKQFNRSKFLDAIKQIRDVVKIKKVSFTGGEPTTNRNLLDSLLMDVRELDLDIFTVVSSNGHNLVDFPAHLVDSLAISRHHYDSGINKSLFGIPMAISLKQDYFINNYPRKANLHLSCNVAKGYIDTPEEVMKYLTYYGSMGIFDFGFVALMPVTPWASEHLVDATEILDRLPNTTKTKTWVRPDGECFCDNYLTQAGNNLVASYARRNLNPSKCESILVFDMDVLRNGFNGPVLL